MAEPWGVVVVPAAGDPGGLLAVHPVWQVRPPVACRWSEGVEWGVEACRWVATTETTNALPLWWDGELVAEGWDRVRRCLHRLDYVQRISSGIGNMTWRTLDAHDPICGQAITIAVWTVATGLASRVVLLDLVDGRLVERGGSDGR